MAFRQNVKPSPNFITANDVEDRLSWGAIVDALRHGHTLNKARLGDVFMERGQDGFLNRATWIDGLGFALKSVTILPANAAQSPPRPSVQGLVAVFDDRSGALDALIDSELITPWKTAADSVLGTQLLARPEPARLVIAGAGRIAEALVSAYSATFPSLEHIQIWARDPTKAASLVSSVRSHANVTLAPDLPVAASQADIVSTATGARSPILSGEWRLDGAHIDLIGAHGPDMREADNALLAKARLFVDSRETTIDHIGELMIPIADGAIAREDVAADLYDLIAGHPGRRSDNEITIFKNGGGAHLDLMTARAIIAAL